MQRINKWKGRAFLLPVIFTLLFILPSSGQLFGQLKYDYEWLFGYNNYPDGQNPDKRFAINLVSFHSNPPDTIRTPLYGSTGLTAAVSIANSEGRILFYSNGCRLFNADGTMVPGGEVLLEGPTFDEYCYLNYPLSVENYPTFTQGRFILPMDDRDSTFFYLYQRQELTHHTDFDEPVGIVTFDLHLGNIKKKEDGFEMISSEVILDQMFANGNMVAVRATRPNHWWIVVPHAPHLNNYESILLGPDGVDTIVTHYADYSKMPFAGRWIWSGQTVTSPQGDRYVWWSPQDTIGTLVFDFDRATGELSNMRHIPHPERDSFVQFYSSGGFGAAISSNGRFLYVNTLTHLYQYDLEEKDLEGSKIHIGEYDGFRDPGFNLPTYFFMQRLAPDCRIYMSSNNTVSWLHVINHPNRKGRACDFRQHSFKLPGNHRFGIPYHPNYRLGTQYPVCDSTLTSTTWFVPEGAAPGIHLYPNPAREYAVMAWSGMDPVEVRLFDMTGRQVLSEPLYPGQPEYYLQLGDIAAGVYVVMVRDRSGGVATERLIVIE